MNDTATIADDRLAPATERHHLIDALRAIALWGVITMNITAMVMALVAGEVFARATPLDGALATFDLVVLQGKARATFALLFGVGFGIMLGRAATRGQPFTGFYLRRMAALLAIGLFNLALLFWGDILILYALLGMTLPLFQRLSDRGLIGVGLALVLVPPLAMGAVELITGAPFPNLAGLSPEAAEAVMPASVPLYRGGSFAGYVGANLDYYVDHWRTDTGYAAIYALGVLGLFLLGLWVARNAVLTDVERWRPLLRRLAWTCLPLGMGLSVLHATRRMGIEADGALYAGVTAAYAGLAITAWGMAAGLALLLSRRWAGLVRALAPMGRMALTGYLTSNAVGAFVFYGWGLGQMGRLSVTAMNALALAVFVGLCLFSTAWLRAFRFGPVEWLWRSVSYRALQPLRRR